MKNKDIHFCGSGEDSPIAKCGSKPKNKNSEEKI
jgi:hypothetical protein